MQCSHFWSVSFTLYPWLVYAAVYDNDLFPFVAELYSICSPIYWLMDISGSSSLDKLLLTSWNESFKKLLLNLLTVSYVNKVHSDYYDSFSLSNFLPPTPIYPPLVFCFSFYFIYFFDLLSKTPRILCVTCNQHWNLEPEDNDLFFFPRTPQ